MKTVRVTIDPNCPETLPLGRVDMHRLDSTTEAEVMEQQQEDEQEALREAALFVRQVRKRLGLSQAEFSRRIEVPVATIRNWEQGKYRPTGAAKTLLKVLNKAPETALEALR
ncbi:helix-turn-helix domain-containing protein [Desulfonatronum thioautotrophicum]|uniref:helix-turn-helix domain-containing protein n=1 Tax=Desulfonatronum thioautotrophicum TaxID=617001 RepID=UPI0005EB33A3|nr:helix-turn-helix domain-containing protein [Desulfonatronum thioautotrophicum]